MDTNNEALKRYYNSKKKRKKRRKYAFYSMLTVFFVLLITMLSLTVFFNINDIAVTGNSYYSDSAVIKISGLEKGQNLFRMNKFRIIEGMYKQMPYASEITIDRHLPVGIEIIIKECTPYMVAQVGKEYCILDENLKVLEKTETAPEKLPLIVGVETDSAVVGEILTDANGVCDRLMKLTQSLKEYIGDASVTGIDVSSSYEVKFEYLDRLEVLVGTVENIDNKLELVKYVIDDNRSNERAVIDVSSGERAYYRSVVEKTEEEEQNEAEKESENNEDTSENSEDTEDSQENE